VSDIELSDLRKLKGRAASCSLKYACRRSFCNRPAVISVVFIALFLFAALPSLAGPARLLVLGDSLSAGYGLSIEQSFPAQLERRLRAQGHDVTVLNAGVSGDTSAGGLARLGWALADKPDFVMIELGANDGLRGLDPAALRTNLEAIIQRLHRAGKGVMLAGMLAPPNMGATYETEFNNVYPTLARKHKIEFYPFFLEGVAANPALNQPDGLHPTAEGIAIIVDRITPYVVRLLAHKNGK
jgi:acyl-CoA thioesterase I